MIILWTMTRFIKIVVPNWTKLCFHSSVWFQDFHSLFGSKFHGTIGSCCLVLVYFKTGPTGFWKVQNRYLSHGCKNEVYILQNDQAERVVQAPENTSEHTFSGKNKIYRKARSSIPESSCDKKNDCLEATKSCLPNLKLSKVTLAKAISNYKLSSYD